MPTPPSSSSAWQARQALGARLGEIRKDAGLTGRALAQRCGWHESKVSRIEHARTAPSADDIRSWCEHCGRPPETEDLITFLRTVEGMFIEWRRMERTGLRRAQEAVLPLWERTRLFRAYSSWLIPGAVQTRAYTTAVLRAIAARRELPDDVEDAVAVRADRLRLLREGDHRFLVLIEESVLRNVIGGPEVMAGQLGHLITVASLPSVSLGIIPIGLERDAVWPVEDFWIFDDRQVNVELVSGWLTLTQPREIAMYAQTFSELSQLAARGAQARTLITAAIDSLG
jgi:transcriptional regulator with XRE-family HTH domain